MRECCFPPIEPREPRKQRRALRLENDNSSPDPWEGNRERIGEESRVAACASAHGFEFAPLLAGGPGAVRGMRPLQTSHQHISTGKIDIMLGFYVF